MLEKIKMEVGYEPETTGRKRESSTTTLLLPLHEMVGSDMGLTAELSVFQTDNKTQVVLVAKSFKRSSGTPALLDAG